MPTDDKTRARRLLIASQAVSLLTLPIWIIFTSMVGMAVESGFSGEDLVKALPLAAFPLFIILSVVVSWWLYKRESYMQAIVWSGIPAVAIIFLGLLSLLAQMMGG
jgi:hypothetical protein